MCAKFLENMLIDSWFIDFASNWHDPEVCMSDPCLIVLNTVIADDRNIIFLSLRKRYDTLQLPVFFFLYQPYVKYREMLLGYAKV